MTAASKILCTLLVVMAASPLAAQPGSETVPVPVPDGWTAPDQEYRYERDNLWEYINGAAELFLAYGFRELAVRDLERDDQFLTVSLYDMGRPLNAFGIYERERPRNGQRLNDLGAEASLQAPYQGLLLKDRFYVKVDAAGGDLSAEDFRSVLAEVAAALPGDDALPVELSYLPEDGRIPGSVEYTHRDFAGLSDLGGVIHAEYQDPARDTAYRLFTFRPGKDPLDRLTRRWHVEEQDGAVVVWREVPYQGTMVMRQVGGQVLGVTGFADREAALAVLVDRQSG
jgi:hypothetical protein